MARKIPRSLTRKYDLSVKRQGAAAERAVRGELRRYFRENPDVSVEDARELAIKLMQGAGDFYGAATSQAALDLLDGISKVEGVPVPSMVDWYYEPDAESIGKTARYHAGKLADGDVEGFVDQIADAARYYAERGANSTMAEVAAKQARRASGKPGGKPRRKGSRTHGVYFARVPMGPTTCDFCLMLASRGFVYLSEESAGEFDRFHRHCDCRIIPGTPGTTAEGYEPDECYDMWKHPDEYKGLDPQERGTLACLRVAEKRGVVEYRKPLLSFIETEDGKRDLVAHAALVRAGVSFTALAEDAPSGYSNIDLLVNGKKYEVKSPNKSNKRAVESSLRKAKSQFERNYPDPIPDVRVVFNGAFYGQGDEWVSHELSRQASAHGIAETIHVGKAGSVIR